MKPDGSKSGSRRRFFKRGAVHLKAWQAGTQAYSPACFRFFGY